MVRLESLEIALTVAVMPQSGGCSPNLTVPWLHYLVIWQVASASVCSTVSLVHLIDSIKEGFKLITLLLGINNAIHLRTTS